MALAPGLYYLHILLFGKNPHNNNNDEDNDDEEKKNFTSPAARILLCPLVLWRSFELHSWFPLQKWSFCGQGVSNHSWLSASHFLTRPFFCLDGTLVYPKYYYHYSMVVVVVQPVSAIQPRTFSLEPALVLLKHMAAAASCIIGLLNMGVKRGLLQLGQY